MDGGAGESTAGGEGDLRVSVCGWWSWEGEGGGGEVGEWVRVRGRPRGGEDSGGLECVCVGRGGIVSL